MVDQFWHPVTQYAELMFSDFESTGDLLYSTFVINIELAVHLHKASQIQHVEYVIAMGTTPISTYSDGSLTLKLVSRFNSFKTSLSPRFCDVFAKTATWVSLGSACFWLAVSAASHNRGIATRLL